MRLEPTALIIHSNEISGCTPEGVTAFLFVSSTAKNKNRERNLRNLRNLFQVTGYKKSAPSSTAQRTLCT
jgi:hypothetical protein